MTVEENKAIVRRYYLEAYNAQNVDVLEELIAPNFTFHKPTSGRPLAAGIDGARDSFYGLITGVPDFTYTIEDLFGEGDKVCARVVWVGTNTGSIQGYPPTGERIELSAIHIFRLENGKIVDRWDERDSIGLMQQLGVVPKRGAATSE